MVTTQVTETLKTAADVIEDAIAAALENEWRHGWIDLPPVPHQGSSGYHAIGLFQAENGWEFTHITNRTGYQRYEERITEQQAVALIGGGLG